MAPDVAIPSPRGSSVHVLELSKGFRDLGHEVHVVCRRTRRSDPPTEIVAGITLHRVFRWIARPESLTDLRVGTKKGSASDSMNFFYYIYLLTFFRLYVAIVVSRLVWVHQIDTILERETSFGAGALASLITRIPLILEIVGPRYSRLSSSRSSFIFYYTDSMLRNWTDRKKCIRVPAGVNVSIFYPDIERGNKVRESLRLHETDVIVGYVGTFQSWHGIDNLLESVTLLKSKYASLRILLVGSKFEKEKDRAKELGISEICTFSGGVEYERVPDYINACDIMVAPYNPGADPLRKKYGIGFPLKILEYMACKKPVISTRVRPIDMLISDESLGLLIDPGNSKQLADGIEALAADIVLRKKMGESGFDLVRGKYSWRSVACFMSGYL